MTSLPRLALLLLLPCFWHVRSSPGQQPLPADVAVTAVRFFPRAGAAAQMKGGAFVGSNETATTDFHPIVTITDAPPEGAWAELAVPKPVAYRYIKYVGPQGSYGSVAEIEFRAGGTKLVGRPFGTAGSRDDSGSDFSKALDGDTATAFQGKSPDEQYVGYDLGPESQAAGPEFTPASGTYPNPVQVTISTARPAAIRYVLNYGTPSATSGDEYKAAVKIDRNALLLAVAAQPGRADSALAKGIYRIGAAAPASAVVRTYHIGNSLTDTVVGTLEDLAASAGRKLDFHRFTIPGAPTEWLWDHPGGGFGDAYYREAFTVLAPINDIFTQPFAGHGRTVDNEADYSGRFFALCRRDSPDVQPWLYCQWPQPDFKDRWSQWQNAPWQGRDLPPGARQPAATWQEGARNHLAYTELVRDRIMQTWPGKPVLIVPGGPALARLKDEIDAGRVPGMTDFVKAVFADGIHMNDAGRYLISLVHYACLYQEDPAGKVSLLKSGLTEEQGRIFQRIAWETASGYPGAGIKTK